MQALLSTVADQREAFAFVVRHPRTLVPAAIRWVERFGGGLGSPVLPFFMLGFGLSPTQQGFLSSVSTLSAILPAPLYGWAQDQYGPYYTILIGATFCGIGCGLEAFALGYAWFVWARFFQGTGGGNLPSVINAHLTSCAPVEKRALILSGFTAQCLLLRICGQAFYLPWETMLRALSLERMLRFRVTLAVCTFFCWFGVLAILRAGEHLRQRVDAAQPSHTGGAADGATKGAADGAAGGTGTGSGASKPSASASCTASAPSVGGSPVAGYPPCATRLAIGACLSSLLLISCYEQLLTTTWPLFLHRWWH